MNYETLDQPLPLALLLLPTSQLHLSQVAYSALLVVAFLLFFFVLFDDIFISLLHDSHFLFTIIARCFCLA